jgi:hypothetical protein
LALAADYLEDGSLVSDLLFRCDPAAVGHGVTGEDADVGGPQHVEIGQCGDDAPVFLLGVLVQEGGGLANFSGCGKVQLGWDGSMAGVAFGFALGSGFALSS